jgi:hypothetical protein
MDVDAGPVLKGYGFAACAFGVGAARVNGHFEHAFPLATEMFAVSCPLPDGTLLVPRLLSNAADAPYLGEAAILFNLTRLPANGASVQTGGSVPLFTFIVLFLQGTIGLLVAAHSLRVIRRWRKETDAVLALSGRWQLGIWSGLYALSLCLLILGHWTPALAGLLGAQLLPWLCRRKPASPVCEKT